MKTMPLPSSTALLLKTAVILIGVGTLGFLLWEPQVEGVNANATLFQIYFQDPFLAYVYAASILFFIALYQAFRLVGTHSFSEESLRVFRTIKYCAIGLVASVVGAELWILLQHGEDDVTGGVAMVLFAMCIFGVLGIAAAFFERHIQRGVERKSNE